MPPNCSSASMARFTGTPACWAAAIAASALSTLCAPITGHCTRPRDLANVETREVAIGCHTCAPPGRRERFACEPFARSPTPHVEHRAHVRVRGVPQDASAPRDEAYELVELALDRLHVGEDIGVVE